MLCSTGAAGGTGAAGQYRCCWHTLTCSGAGAAWCCFTCLGSKLKAERFSPALCRTRYSLATEIAMSAVRACRYTAQASGHTRKKLHTVENGLLDVKPLCEALDAKPVYCYLLGQCAWLPICLSAAERWDHLDDSFHQHSLVHIEHFPGACTWADLLEQQQRIVSRRHEASPVAISMHHHRCHLTTAPAQRSAAQCQQCSLHDQMSITVHHNSSINSSINSSSINNSSIINSSIINSSSINNSSTSSPIVDPAQVASPLASG